MYVFLLACIKYVPVSIKIRRECWFPGTGATKLCAATRVLGSNLGITQKQAFLTSKLSLQSYKDSFFKKL